MEAREYRVYGPPGTGKTAYVVRKATELAERFGEDQISICSLTRAAVKVVMKRDHPLDQESVTTLHARCKRALQAPPPAEAMMRKFAEDCRAFAQPGHDIPTSRPRLDALEEGEEDDLGWVRLYGDGSTNYERAQFYRQQMIPKDKWPIAGVKRWYEVWSEWCREEGQMDYVGWLETALEVRPLPTQQVVFVDEAQDHTPLQLAVIRSWNCRHRYLVGDDDQSLYQWAGAIPERLFEVEIPSDREHVLSQSFRVPRAVYREALPWLRYIPRRKEKDYQPRDHEGEVIRCDYALEDASADLLPPGLLEDDGQTYMILASCAYMLDPMISLLRRRRIPFGNPYRRTDHMWNPLLSVAERLKAFLVDDRLWTGKEALAWSFALKANPMFQAGRREDFRRLCADVSDRKLTYDELAAHLSPEGMERVLGRDVSIFRRYRRLGVPGYWDYALGAYEKGSVDFWNPRVIVGTIHSIKGGEADVVYLSPDLSPAGRESCHRIKERDQVARMFYVGITRARDKLYWLESNNTERRCA